MEAEPAGGVLGDAPHRGWHRAVVSEGYCSRCATRIGRSHDGPGWPEILGVEVAADDQAQAFGQAIANAAESSSIPLETAFADGARHLQLADFGAEEIRQWVTGAVSSRDTRALGRSPADAEGGAAALKDFQDYFRAGVDSSPRGPVGGDGPPSDEIRYG